MATRKKFIQNTIAIAYDFDGTLCPQPMQEYTVLPKIDLKPKVFWDEVNDVAEKTESESMLVYMRLLLEKADQSKVHISESDFKDMAKDIRYFPGVEKWFETINTYVKEKGKNKIKVQHYIISAGMREILEGIKIYKYFSKIYASEYYYDHHKVAKFPKILITDTSKTQYLFRINKGREKLTESINDHMPESERPIPFSNIIYIGDGITDVPSMAVTKMNGGHTIAVYKPKQRGAAAKCAKLLDANRVDFIAPADYSLNKPLMRRMELLLNSIIANIEYKREVYSR